jgi:hypothetical protein
MIQLSKLRYFPDKIADILRSRYSLTKKVCGRRNVESRLRYLKMHGAPLPPTNIEVDLHAGCMWFYFFTFIQLILTTGQHSALSLANRLTEPAASPASDEDSESSKEEECAPIEPTVDLLQKLGLVYVHPGKTTWTVFICRALNAEFDVLDPVQNGIQVTWNAHGPLDDELLLVKEKTHTEVREYQFSDSSFSFFVPSDRTLSLDSAKISISRIPEKSPRWMVVSIPYLSNEKHVISNMKAGHLAEEKELQ